MNRYNYSSNRKPQRTSMGEDAVVISAMSLYDKARGMNAKQLEKLLESKLDKKVRGIMKKNGANAYTSSFTIKQGTDYVWIVEFFKVIK